MKPPFTIGLISILLGSTLIRYGNSALSLLWGINLFRRSGEGKGEGGRREKERKRNEAQILTLGGN